MPDRIETLEELRALYPPVKERALRKQLPSLDPHCRRFIALSPFIVMATVGEDGLADASPRGGAPGFVQVLDDACLLIPDASGNNRLDSLQNIVQTGRLGLLFLVPGVDETLRVNGTASLTTAADRMNRFVGLDKLPKLVIQLQVHEAYLHCAKSLMRSKLWSADTQVHRSSLPTMGQMLHDQIGGDAPVETQDAMLARYRAEL